MSKRICSIIDCGAPFVARGWCSHHYERWRMYGDPLGARRQLSVYDRVMAMSHPDPSGCRIFTGARTEKGYGRVGTGDGSNRQVYAHRAVWAHHNGPIPMGMIVMHSCDVPSCCEISHLSIGTYADNTADMIAKGRHWAQK